MRKILEWKFTNRKRANYGIKKVATLDSMLSWRVPSHEVGSVVLSLLSADLQCSSTGRSSNETNSMSLRSLTYLDGGGRGRLEKTVITCINDTIKS